MTVSSKPQDDDALIERKRGPLGEEMLVGTPLFLRFLNDLVDLFNIDSPDLSQTQSTLFQVKAELSSRLLAISNELAEIERAALLSHENKTVLHRVSGSLSDAEKAIQALKNENAQLKSKLSQYQAQQSELERRISNLEQVAWR